MILLRRWSNCIVVGNQTEGEKNKECGGEEQEEVSKGSQQAKKNSPLLLLLSQS